MERIKTSQKIISLPASEYDHATWEWVEIEGEKNKVPVFCSYLKDGDNHLVLEPDAIVNDGMSWVVYNYINTGISQIAPLIILWNFIPDTENTYSLWFNVHNANHEKIIAHHCQSDYLYFAIIHREFFNYQVFYRLKNKFRNRIQNALRVAKRMPYATDAEFTRVYRLNQVDRDVEKEGWEANKIALLKAMEDGERLDN